jgi:hypothetical protein
MKARPVAVTDNATGENDVGDEAMAMREISAGADMHEGAKRRLGECRNEMN